MQEGFVKIEGFYNGIDKDGNVIELEHSVKCKNGTKVQKQKEIMPDTANGIPIVRVKTADGHITDATVDALMSRAYLNNRIPLTAIYEHRDGDRLNTSLNNLIVDYGYIYTKESKDGSIVPIYHASKIPELSGEVWKMHYGYPVECSSFGRFKNYKGKFCLTYLTGESVTVYFWDKQKKKSVGRSGRKLCYEAFRGPIPGKSTTRTLNGVSCDGRIENLIIGRPGGRLEKPEDKCSDYFHALRDRDHIGDVEEVKADNEIPRRDNVMSGINASMISLTEYGGETLILENCKINILDFANQKFDLIIGKGTEIGTIRCIHFSGTITYE